MTGVRGTRRVRRPSGFLLQVDQSFVDANIGDGVLYAYDDGAFWQR